MHFEPSVKENKIRFKVRFLVTEPFIKLITDLPLGFKKKKCQLIRLGFPFHGNAILLHTDLLSSDSNAPLRLKTSGPKSFCRLLSRASPSCFIKIEKNEVKDVDGTCKFPSGAKKNLISDKKKEKNAI